MMEGAQICSISSVGDSTEGIRRTLEHMEFAERTVRRIVLKPNWVRHEVDPLFPIRGLVTSSALIEAVIDACLERYPELEEITVGDVPLQSCDWEKLVRQAGIAQLIRKYERYRKPRICFLDLRRECAVVSGGYLRLTNNPSGGDPKGYAEVALDDGSFLDPISGSSDTFRVSDYSAERTTSSHQRGHHRYVIARSALDCDLFINLPKVKTHQKAGITGALKNLVGINGDKANLAHFRTARNGQFGDEFPPNVSSLVVLQTRVRDVLQGRSRPLFSVLRAGWKVLRRVAGIETRGTVEALRCSNGNFFLSGGAWHGNDTIWRMVYDLNRIIRYAPREGGRLQATLQRQYMAIADGIVAGEGNGPLQPLPVDLGVLLASEDPFLLDTVMARIMGFDHLRIPMLQNARLFGTGDWGSFNPSEVGVVFDGRMVFGIENVPVLHRFIPPPGWKHHLELPAEVLA